MHLVACRECHRQYDVTNVKAPHFDCACGTRVATAAPTARDRDVHRCSACGAHVEPGAHECTYCSASIKVDLAAGTLICPECFARNGARADFCHACGVRFAPQPVQIVAGDLACPVCAEPMRRRSIATTAVEECTTCLGLWIPGAEFDALIRRAAEAHAARSEEARLPSTDAQRHKSQFSSEVVYRQCPVCAQRMLRRNFDRRSGIIIDRCPDHGTWLDADELEDIAAHIVHAQHQRHVAGPSAPAPEPAPASDAADRQRAIAELLIQQERVRSQQARSHSVHLSFQSIRELLSDLLG